MFKYIILLLCVCLKLMIIIYVLICKKYFLVQNINRYLPTVDCRQEDNIVDAWHALKQAGILRFNKGLKAEMIMVQVSKHKTNN